MLTVSVSGTLALHIAADWVREGARLSAKAGQALPWQLLQLPLQHQQHRLPLEALLDLVPTLLLAGPLCGCLHVLHGN